jgi:hypothetical protein
MSPSRNPSLALCLQIIGCPTGLELATFSRATIPQKVLQRFARVCKIRILEPFSFPCLAPCCTVLRSRWCQSSVNITLTSPLDWKLPRAGSTTFVARRPTAPEPCPPRPHVSTSDTSLASCRGCATMPGTRPSPCCARVLGRRGCQGRPRTPAPRGAVAHPRSFVGGEVVHHHDLPRP